MNQFRNNVALLGLGIVLMGCSTTGNPYEDTWFSARKGDMLLAEKRTELAGLNSELSRYSQDIAALQSRLTTIQSQKRVDAAEFTSLQRRLMNAESKLQSAHDELGQLGGNPSRSDYLQLEHQKMELEAIVEALNQDLDQLIGTYTYQPFDGQTPAY